MRVALLTTGKTEFFGFPTALTALFPGHHFESVGDVPGRPFHGFTSARLPAPTVLGVESALDKIVKHAVALVDPQSPREATWDLVLFIEDLELANLDQPQTVCDVVRQSVKHHISQLGRPPEAAASLEVAVRERVSFHLLVPMIEAWFFGAPSALTSLGVTSAFHKKGDPEKFESTHQDYLNAIASQCSGWCRNHRPKDDRPKWIREDGRRAEHPKGYLQWLLICPEHKTCTRYREGEGGAATALAKIDWAQLFTSLDRMRWARTLVQDIAERLGVQPTIDLEGEVTPHTERRASPSMVLRNV